MEKKEKEDSIDEKAKVENKLKEVLERKVAESQESQTKLKASEVPSKEKSETTQKGDAPTSPTRSGASTVENPKPPTAVNAPAVPSHGETSQEKAKNPPFEPEVEV